jgi:uncharacterized protein (DUF433 family)
MSIKLSMEPRSVPLTLTENGVWRVTGTRIPLERIVECHKAGYAPEDIVDAFDVLKLSDVYLVLGYYLEHKEEVKAYINERENKAQEIRRKLEANLPPSLTREELLARKARRERENDQAGS